MDAEIEKAADRLLRAGDDLIDVLGPRLRAMHDERRRAVMTGVVEAVRVDFDQTEKNGRIFSQFTGGEIRLFNLKNRVNRTRLELFAAPFPNWTSSLSDALVNI